MDGKHIRMGCPKLTGSWYFDLKGFFSMVLLGICDPNYWFVLFNLGQYLSNKDGGVLLNLLMSQIFQENRLKVPKCPSSENVGDVPVYLAAIYPP